MLYPDKRKQVFLLRRVFVYWLTKYLHQKGWASEIEPGTSHTERWAVFISFPVAVIKTLWQNQWKRERDRDRHRETEIQRRQRERDMEQGRSIAEQWHSLSRQEAENCCIVVCIVAQLPFCTHSPGSQSRNDVTHSGWVFLNECIQDDITGSCQRSISQELLDSARLTLASHGSGLGLDDNFLIRGTLE